MNRCTDMEVLSVSPESMTGIRTGAPRPTSPPTEDGGEVEQGKGLSSPQPLPSSAKPLLLPSPLEEANPASFCRSSSTSPLEDDVQSPTSMEVLVPEGEEQELSSIIEDEQRIVDYEPEGKQHDQQEAHECEHVRFQQTRPPLQRQSTLPSCSSSADLLPAQPIQEDVCPANLFAGLQSGSYSRGVPELRRPQSLCLVLLHLPCMFCARALAPPPTSNSFSNDPTRMTERSPAGLGHPHPEEEGGEGGGGRRDGGAPPVPPPQVLQEPAGGGGPRQVPDLPQLLHLLLQPPVPQAAPGAPQGPLPADAHQQPVQAGAHEGQGRPRLQEAPVPVRQAGAALQGQGRREAALPQPGGRPGLPGARMGGRQGADPVRVQGGPAAPGDGLRRVQPGEELLREVQPGEEVHPAGRHHGDQRGGGRPGEGGGGPRGQDAPLPLPARGRRPDSDPDHHQDGPGDRGSRGDHGGGQAGRPRGGRGAAEREGCRPGEAVPAHLQEDTQVCERERTLQPHQCVPHGPEERADFHVHHPPVGGSRHHCEHFLQSGDR
ncbi:apical junction component 1 [Caerostris extrusa]|uniref:Apical junction component 1 n=1 Tax=Caerostris extrusa TaxID=172846 RepID=A0AAV4WI65_CAEEX|nr:apical junction component 1 [Caerostris extrusa]